MSSTDDFTQKELAALLERWKNELLKVTKDYQIAIKSIDTAVDNLKTQKEKWYTKSY